MTDLLPLVAAGLAFALLVWLTLARPWVTFVLYLVTGPAAQIPHMTAWGERVEYFAVAGVRPADAVLVVLGAAAAVRLLGAALLRRWPWPATLSAATLSLVAWLLYSVLRNLDRYGLSAAGEFRFLYLVLAAPVAAAVLLERPEDRRRVTKALLILTVPVLTAALPVLAVLTDWRVGTGYRLLPSGLSLALGLGWATLALASRAFGVPRWAVVATAAPTAFVVLVDSHRSVWLALTVAAVCAALLAGMGRLARSRWTLPVTAVLTLVLVAVVAGGAPLLPFLAERSRAFTDPSRDPTANWRQHQWRAALGEWSERPWRGEGFGGYWRGLAMRGGADVVPHNLYVQTLTKTGAVGLAALVVTVASALAALAGMARQAAGDIPPPHLDGALALAGFLALVAALGYGVAYYLEPVTLLLVGLGVAAAVHGEEPCVAPAPDVVWAARWARGAAGETPS